MRADPNDRKPRPWTVPTGGKGSFVADGYHLGKGTTPLEVAVAATQTRPTESDVRNLWKRRKGNQASPLLLIVLWHGATGEKATVCGACPVTIPLFTPIVIPSRSAGLHPWRSTNQTSTRPFDSLPPICPRKQGAPQRLPVHDPSPRLNECPNERTGPVSANMEPSSLGLRREQLDSSSWASLIEPKGQAARAACRGQRMALAVFLDDSDNPDAAAARFNGMTPVSWGIASAAADNIPYVVVTRGPQIRIYTTRAGAGSAGKGGSKRVRGDQPALLTLRTTRATSRCSVAADSLSAEGLFLRRCWRRATTSRPELGNRRRVPGDTTTPYRTSAQALIALYEADGGDTDSRSLSALYDRALLVLFRLLFVAYSEDRDLLPLRTNGLYRQRFTNTPPVSLRISPTRMGGTAVFCSTRSATDLWGRRPGALWTADRQRAKPSGTYPDTTAACSPRMRR